MRKLVRTVIINNEDDDEDDETSHRHHHVSAALVCHGDVGAARLRPGLGGRQLRTRQNLARQQKAGGRVLWKQPHGRSWQNSGTWRRLLFAKGALQVLLEDISEPEGPRPAAERLGGAGREAELVPAWLGMKDEAVGGRWMTPPGGTCTILSTS